MIKLIASDMDGTLLNEHGEVPPETFDLIEALREKGVHFAASSGRRYDRLCTFFEPVRDHMDFVASNGAQLQRLRQSRRTLVFPRRDRGKSSPEVLIVLLSRIKKGTSPASLFLFLDGFLTERRPKSAPLSFSHSSSV